MGGTRPVLLESGTSQRTARPRLYHPSRRKQRAEIVNRNRERIVLRIGLHRRCGFQRQIRRRLCYLAIGVIERIVLAQRTAVRRRKSVHPGSEKSERGNTLLPIRRFSPAPTLGSPLSRIANGECFAIHKPNTMRKPT
jgi:hypothetical protein